MTIYPEECHETTSTEDEILYRINFDSSGNIIVSNLKGMQIPGSRVDFPIECQKILDIKNIEIIEVKGSHFILVRSGGTTYKYELAH